MAGKAATAPSTYSPSPTQKTRPPIFKDVDWVRPDGPPIFKDVDWVRPDGRGFLQCRPAFLRTGAVNAASGSAYAGFGNTKVDRNHIEGVLAIKAGTGCRLLFWLKEGDGSCNLALSDLPVVISCACLALADAGIMMYDLVSSVSVSCLGEKLAIYPISEEESYQDGSLLITCLPSRNEVTQLTLTGEWSTPKIHEAVELCLDACSKLGEIMGSCLKEAVTTSQE